VGWAHFSGHSLRAGLATAAGEAGADLAQVMRQTRHRSAEVAMGLPAASGYLAAKSD
jgi:integrase